MPQPSDNLVTTLQGCSKVAIYNLEILSTKALHIYITQIFLILENSDCTYGPAAVTRVTFSPKESNASFDVKIKDDNIFKINETFCAKIISDCLPYGVAIGGIQSITISIENDDSKYLAFKMCIYTYV